MGWLKFNNITTNKEELGNPNAIVIEGAVVQAPPVYEFPSKRYEAVQILGKNGDLLIHKNSYDNVKREYNLAFVFKSGVSFIQTARQIVDWFNSVNGYARLEDSYEPDYFRLAVFRSGGQLPNFFDKATGLIVSFECKPQRFLKSGEIPVDLIDSQWVTLINNTSYVALPQINLNGNNVIIEVQRKVDGTYVETSKVEIDGVTGECVVDSEIQDCYNSNEFLNNVTEVTNEFPKLYPGENRIKIVGITNANIKPKWWVL